MAEFPALPLWTDAYLADTTHLSEAEHGRYLMFLFHLWRAPSQRFPNDDGWLARKFRQDENWVREALRPLIAEFCQTDGNWITQKRLAREWKYVVAHSQKQSARAKSRWQKEKGLSPGNAERHLSGTTPTPTPTPTLLEIESSSLPSLSSEKKENLHTNNLGNGTGRAANGHSNGQFTITNPADRIARFQTKLAPVVDGGWLTIAAATDNTNPQHRTALATCQTAARDKLGKGWPRNWPTTSRY